MKLVSRQSLTAKFLQRNSDQYHVNHPFQGTGELDVTQTDTISNGKLYDHRAYREPKGEPFGEATFTYDYADAIGDTICHFNGREVYMRNNSELHMFESRAAAELFLAKKEGVNNVN